MRRERAGLFVVLILLGIGWGLTQPLTKIAVSEGYRTFGLIFWQFVIAIAILGALSILRRRPPRLGRRQLVLYAFIALVGTILPDSASYEAARHLPAGIMALIMSTVPLMALPIALAMGNERFAWSRLGGLVVGLVGVLVVLAPGVALPQAGQAVFVAVALIAPAFYGLEANAVARWGTFGADGIQTLLGASLIDAPVAAVLAVATGTWITPGLPLTGPDLALIGSSCIHALAYATYVWLVTRAGSVFAAQVSYPVTGAGIVMSMLILRESYGPLVWLSLALILAGLFMVQPLPRRGAALAPAQGS